MAKTKSSQWHDLAIILLIILVVATNAYWLLVTNDLNSRLDTHVDVINQNTSRITQLEKE